MKRIYFLFLLLPLFAASQQPAKEVTKSKLEAFSERSGTLIQKTFIDIGKVNGLQVQIQVIENMTDHSKLSGLRLEAVTYSSLGADTKIAFIDPDEIEGLLTSLKYFKDKLFATSPENYTETSFTSRTGLNATAFQDNKKKWSVALKLEKYDSRSTVYLKEDSITELIALIEKAKTQMQN